MAEQFDADFMQAPVDEQGLLRLSGSIEHVIYSNDENGYAICDLGTDTDELVTITGTMPYIAEGPKPKRSSKPSTLPVVN